ncbi:MAG: hypothetical protein CO149_07165 [Nitrospirae bacterium CG_4_9_14_3_um_filter_51_5]|nr:MAG: hypothetical protein CO149_07165 [Nitrospirae bacterium CG_4_9_14_3_um_filter_51_5]
MTIQEIPARDPRNDRVEKDGSRITNVGDDRLVKSVLYGFITMVVLFVRGEPKDLAGPWRLQAGHRFFAFSSE